MIGYSISHTKGQKNDFVKAVKNIQNLLVPGTNHTLDNKTMVIRSEDIQPYKKVYEVEVRADNEIGSVTFQIHGPNSKQNWSIGINKPNFDKSKKSQGGLGSAKVDKKNSLM